MLQCTRCKRTFNALTRHQLDPRSGWCRACLEVWQRENKMRYGRFQTAFNQHLMKSGGRFSTQDSQSFKDYAVKLGIPPEQAFGYVKATSIQLMQRALACAKADGIITPEEERELWTLQNALMLSSESVVHIRNEVKHLRTLQNIRAGQLPAVTSSIALPSTETCYWEAACTYHKVLTSSVKMLFGHLIVTNSKVRFVSAQGGFEFPLNKIAAVRFQPGGINLQLTRTQGNGFYELQNADMVYEVLHYLLNAYNRQVVQKQAGTRSISQEIKVAVWQRDEGKCVQCGATDYLEFDHIIPWSKGGASSINNVQLLCRRCNGAKSDRI